MIFRKISNAGDIHQLQEDLVILIQWSKKWHMTFYVETCKVMHVGNHNDQKVNYFIQGCQLDECHEEKDLGFKSGFPMDASLFKGLSDVRSAKEISC